MSTMSEARGEPLPRDIRTLREMFLDSLSKYPDQLALAAVHQPADLYQVGSVPLEDDDDYLQNPYLRWTYTALDAAILTCMAGLKAHGLRPGMPLFTFNANGAEHIITHYAASEIGAVFVPINPRNLANREEVLHMIKTASAVVPGKRSVVMTSSPDLIEPLEELGAFQDSIKIVVSSQEESQGWTSFEQIMAAPLTNGVNGVKTNGGHTNGHSGDDSEDEKLQDSYVMFTSGTTSMPKGCFRKHPVSNMNIESWRSIPGKANMQPGDRVCGVMPNNHAMGHLWPPVTYAMGGAMVYPGPTFQPDVMLKTLHREKISQTVLVPTMMFALIGLKSSTSYKLDHLKSVMFGGSVLSPDILKSCVEELGTRGVENGYGMTEGVIVRSMSQGDPASIVDGAEVSCGWVIPGQSIRVVDPDTNAVLPRNALGELHASAPMIQHYVNDAGSDNFYTDAEGREWFKTGDQARMDEKGRTFITGRYKDMIIRGGENMSPTAIEAAISKDLQLAAMLPQVVGAPDAIAGEVPIAIVLGKVDADVRQRVQDAVIQAMGNIYVPEDVISLQDMGDGLTDYPRTMAGKIQKTKLSALVKKHRAAQDAGPTAMDDARIADEVRDIWAKAVGLEPSKLSLDAQVGEFADSITVMRVRDTVRRRTGKTLSLVEMSKAGTISAQIELLKKQGDGAGRKENKREVRAGPPGVEDMAHLIEDPELFEPTKKLIVDTISPLGLDWDDVEDVVPAYDFSNVMLESGLFHSWGFKFAMISAKADKAQFRKALEASFKNNRVVASFIVSDKQALGSSDFLHVLMRQNDKFFDKIFRDCGKVKSSEELRAKSYNYRDQVAYPGPLCRIDMYEVEETGTCGVVMNVDHAVVDASTGLIWRADFDKSFDGSPALSEHVDYKLWADSYFNQRTTAEARAAVRWHARRLKGIRQHREALWPPYVMPNDAGEYTVAGYDEDALHYSFEAPEILAFRQQHPKITATVVAKTAFALFLANRTGHSHAMFANYEAARTTFPFLPRAVEATGQFEATDVSGPTMQAVANVVEVRPEETALEFLQRMQQGQLDLTAHAAAPLRQIMAALEGDGDGGMIPEIIGHCSFNWVPGMGAYGTNPNQTFESLSAVVRVRQGLSSNFGLGGPEGSTFFIDLRTVHFDMDGLRQVGGEIEKITKWLLARENWDAAVGGYTAAL
ncbi:putative NRPS-like protein biosynthetic cluster [Pestalotiopsis sp. IQ-011]